MLPGVARVSVIVITRNETRNIGAALESVRWADDIVVVDSGSTDDTVAIARRYTDRVVTHPWEGYGAQKNYAAGLAAHDWVFSLDADERVTLPWRRSLARSSPRDPRGRRTAYPGSRTISGAGSARPTGIRTGSCGCMTGGPAAGTTGACTNRSPSTVRWAGSRRRSSIARTGTSRIT